MLREERELAVGSGQWAVGSGLLAVWLGVRGYWGGIFLGGFARRGASLILLAQGF